MLVPIYDIFDQECDCIKIVDPLWLETINFQLLIQKILLSILLAIKQQSSIMFPFNPAFFYQPGILLSELAISTLKVKQAYVLVGFCPRTIHLSLTALQYYLFDYILYFDLMNSNHFSGQSFFAHMISDYFLVRI